MNDQRFKLSLHIHVDRIAPTYVPGYVDVPLTYGNIDYNGVVVVEGLLVQLLDKLVQAGIAKTDDPAAIAGLLGVAAVPAAPKKV